MEPKSTKSRSKAGCVFVAAVLVDFALNLMPKWSQVRTKVEAKTDLSTKRPLSLKCDKTQYFFNDFRVRGNRFGKKKLWKIDEIRSQRRSAFWHRLLIDFGSLGGGFGEWCATGCDGVRRGATVFELTPSELTTWQDGCVRILELYKSLITSLLPKLETEAGNWRWSWSWKFVLCTAAKKSGDSM